MVPHCILRQNFRHFSTRRARAVQSLSDERSGIIGSISRTGQKQSGKLRNRNPKIWCSSASKPTSEFPAYLA